MKVDIKEIIVEEKFRIRKDVGDLDTLQSSIAKVGLINPVLIDENNILIAGYRRLTACRNLGWQEIEVTVVTLNGDQIRMLDVEIAENFFRKDFTPDEILATETRRREIMAQQREIGFWEKCWTWLKSFFLPQPHDPPEENATGGEKMPPPGDDAEPESKDGAGVAADEETLPAPETADSDSIDGADEPADETSRKETDPSTAKQEQSA